MLFWTPDWFKPVHGFFYCTAISFSLSSWRCSTDRGRPALWHLVEKLPMSCFGSSSSTATTAAWIDWSSTPLSTTKPCTHLLPLIPLPPLLGLALTVTHLPLLLPPRTCHLLPLTHCWEIALNNFVGIHYVSCSQRVRSIKKFKFTFPFFP